MTLILGCLGDKKFNLELLSIKLQCFQVNCTVFSREHQVISYCTRPLDPFEVVSMDCTFSVGVSSPSLLCCELRFASRALKSS